MRLFILLEIIYYQLPLILVTGSKCFKRIELNILIYSLTVSSC